MSKGKKTAILIALFLLVTYVIIVFFLKLPIYWVLLIYAVCFLAAFIIFNSTFLAIIGNYYHATGKAVKANKFLKKAIDKNTKSPTAYLNYSITLVREGQGKEAMEYLQKSLTLNPPVITDKNIMLTMGSCYWVMGDIDAAIEVLEGMRKKYTYVNAHVYVTLAYMYFLKDDLETALELTNKAIEDQPQSGAAWDNLGQIYYKQGDIQKAKESFESAVSYKEDLPDSNYYLGVIAEKEGNAEKAKIYFQKAMNCNITSLNTITKDEVAESYKKYKD